MSDSVDLIVTTRTDLREIIRDSVSELPGGSRNFSGGKTDNKSEAITLARIIDETRGSNEAALSQVMVSERRFTLPEIAKAARRWLAPEPLENLLHELKGEAESEPTLAPARATDRERNRAYEKLRSLGKLHR
ncbi:MAG: hypothetical protein WBM75_05115 [Polyangiales bacterium]